MKDVRQADSAKELWDHFEDTYKSKNSSRLMQLLQSLSNIKMLPTEYLTEYFSQARTIQSDLHTAGQDVSDTQVLLSVLNGLPKAYSTVATVLTTTGKAHGLDTVFPSGTADQSGRISADAHGKSQGFSRQAWSQRLK